MRIQHNIMAMSAYRNYNTNTSAVAKNLEKLSSGYKINRAGDDAAGLAISEKMRAQITGLNAAQKNVKDGISLVKTAEGAMQEIQDMLNRMDYLATQSANGTYDNEVDRAALQKEVEQLKSEINRIADSANFNGIKLLDGSLEDGAMTGVKYTASTAEQVKNMFVNTDWTGKTQLDVDAGKGVLETESVAASKAGFQISLDNIGSIKGGDKFNLVIGDDTLEVDLAAGDYTPSTLASAVAAANNGKFTYDGNEYTVTAEGNTLKFETEAKAYLKEAAKVSWYVGDEVPDPTDTSVDYTTDLSALATGADALADGDKIKIAGTDFTFATDLKTTLDGQTVTDADGKTYTLAVDDNNILTITAEDGEMAAPTVSAGPAGTDTTVNAANATNGADGTKASATVTLSASGKSITVDGTTIAYDTMADATDVDAGDFTYSIDAATHTITFTAKDAGTAGNSLKVQDEDGNDVAFTGGAESTKGTAEYDLSAFANNAGGSITIDGQTVNWDTDLATTIGQINSTNFDIDLDEATNTLTLTAKTAATGTDAPANVIWNDATATNFDVAQVEAPKSGYINSGMQNPTSFNDGGSAQVANGVVNFSSAWSDGSKIKIGDTTYTVALGADSKFKNAANVVDLSDLEAGGANLNKIAAERLAAAAKDNGIFTVGHDGEGKTTLQQKTSVKETTDMSTVDKFASYLGVSTADAESLENATAGKALTLQIGDTSDSYNQLQVKVGDMHTAAMGIADLNIGNQTDAAAAIQTIRNAINYVSGVRGDLGATQNRLEHTANNLSVMAENIQDAESTIRDTDIAEEMMSYTKNNILVQSAQAMLAQANQVPQGVLQLLG